MSGGVVTATVTTYSPNGAVVTGKTVTVTSADGLTKTVSLDHNGDNAVDLVRASATVVNGDGSSTVTATDRARNNALIAKTETTTSADALTVTTKSDIDGDGTFEFTTTNATVVGPTGGITTTETTKSEDNVTLQSRRVTILNSSRSTTTIRDDINGDGKNDRVHVTAKQNTGIVVETLSAYSRAEALTSQIVTTTSADGLSVTSTADLDGNGTTDLTTTDVTVLNADGSRTGTVSVLGPTSALRRKLITTTSASGLSTTVQEDLDGNGTIDLTTTDVTTIANSGIRQRTITRKAGTTVIGTTSVQTSRTGLSVTTETDADGDGDLDTRTVDATTLYADGSTIRNVTNTNLDLSTRSRTKTETSRDGKSVTIYSNLGGSTAFDRTEAIVKQADGKVVNTVTGYDLVTSVKNYGRTETTSADGTSWTRLTDENGDGVTDEAETRTLIYNADGSTRETYTNSNSGWNVTTGESTNYFTMNVDVSADKLTKNIAVTGLNQTQPVSRSVVDKTIIASDGGTARTVTVNYFPPGAVYKSERRITTDARQFTKREDLDIGTDGAFKEKTESTINEDGSTTNSYEYGILSPGGLSTYQIVTDVSADGLLTLTRSTPGFGATFDMFETDQKLVDGTTIRTVQHKDQAGIVKDATTTETSFDGRTVTVQYDVDGNGSADRTEQTITTINANGSTTTTRSEYNAVGVLRDRIVSTTSANGLGVTATIDLDGDGVVDESFTDMSIIEADGSTTRAIKTLYSDGSKKNETLITTSSDGLSRTTRQDIDGNGVYDFVTVDSTYASGMNVVTVSRYSASNTLMYRDKTTTSANGRIVRVDRDKDGNGTVDGRNFYRAVAGHDASYDAIIQNFMSSPQVDVNQFVDENGVVWFKTWKNGSWSPLYVGTLRSLDVQAKMRADIYDVIFDRDMADVEGNIPPIGITFGQLITSLLGGLEFEQRYGTLTNAQLIERMHANAYDRGATLTELKSWLSRFQTSSAIAKQEIVVELAQSAEHRTIGNVHHVTTNTFNITGNFVKDITTDKIEAKIIVDRLFVTGVARHITSTNTLIQLFLDGQRTESQIANSLVTSTEFQTKYGTLTDQAFVDQMFQNGLGRAATTAEKTSWATLIGTGTISRADFVVAIANSPDYTPGLGVSASSAATSGTEEELLSAASDAPVAASRLATTAPSPVQHDAIGGGADASMLRLVQAMASMTPQRASETTLPLAAIPAPEHRLASPLH